MCTLLLRCNHCFHHSCQIIKTTLCPNQTRQAIYRPTLNEKMLCNTTQTKSQKSQPIRTACGRVQCLSSSQHSAQHKKTHTNLMLWLWIASPDSILCYDFPCGKWGICYVISDVSELPKSVSPSRCWMINIHEERFWCGRGYTAQRLQK